MCPDSLEPARRYGYFPISTPAVPEMILAMRVTEFDDLGFNSCFRTCLVDDNELAESFAVPEYKRIEIFVL